MIGSAAAAGRSGEVEAGIVEGVLAHGTRSASVLDQETERRRRKRKRRRTRRRTRKNEGEVGVETVERTRIASVIAVQSARRTRKRILRKIRKGPRLKSLTKKHCESVCLKKQLCVAAKKDLKANGKATWTKVVTRLRAESRMRGSGDVVTATSYFLKCSVWIVILFGFLWVTYLLWISKFKNFVSQMFIYSCLFEGADYSFCLFGVLFFSDIGNLFCFF